ncbi:MAG TPA: HDOD domain-containing protein [Thermodesulfobacteriota bacterium]|nr:HDOD domain-containing protein [Thermodesulfobacteriota bacterium]
MAFTEAIQEFYTLPTVYSSLIEILNDPASTIEMVSDLIACDQASASKVLKIVNSPLYGYSGQIDTISRAVVILGFNEIYSLILSSGIMDFFTPLESLSRFQPVEFWRHSIAVGIAAKNLGRLTGQPRQENYFIAGVLHDIGKLIFFQQARETFSWALELSEIEKQPISSMESKLFSLDHGRAGALLAAQWHFPEPTIRAIQYHEQGGSPQKGDVLVAAVHLGNILARALELGNGGDDLIPRPNPEALELLNLKPGALTGMIPSLLKDYDEICQTLL